MKKMLAGGLALGFVGVGTALVAAPGGAQGEAPRIAIQSLDADLSPTSVAGGGTVTVTSTDPCPETSLGGPTTQVVWGYNNPGWLDPEEFFNAEEIPDVLVVDEGIVPVDADGNWTVTFQATTAPGTYDFFAVCYPDIPAAPSGDADEDAGAMTEAAEATTLSGGHDDGDEGGECPELEPQTRGGDGDGGGEPCPDPCPPVDDVSIQGGDGSSTSTTTCPTTPPSSDTTEPPPPPNPTVSVYGPKSFTVTPGAAPVVGEPTNTG